MLGFYLGVGIGVGVGVGALCVWGYYNNCKKGLFYDRCGHKNLAEWNRLSNKLLAQAPQGRCVYDLQEIRKLYVTPYTKVCSKHEEDSCFVFWNVPGVCVLPCNDFQQVHRKWKQILFEDNTLTTLDQLIAKHNHIVSSLQRVHVILAELDDTKNTNFTTR